MTPSTGCIVTIAAAGCQKKIAREIKEADADYVLALKGNQEAVHEEVKSFLDAALAEKQAPRPVGAKLSRGPRPWRSGRRWKRTTGGWNPALLPK